MNRDRFAGSWRQLKGLVRETWGLLTADEAMVIEGREEQLVGLLQRRYGSERPDVRDRPGDLPAPEGGSP